jgi:GntR family transcriptional regulator
MNPNPPLTHIDQASPLPKYYQLKEALRGLITALQPDQLIPSESELCDTYQISRTTVRKALNDLIHEGLLYTVQGKGTFVSNRKLRSFWAQTTRGFAEEMAQRGYKITTQVLSFTTMPATDTVASALEIQPAEPVCEIVRLRSLDQQPFDLATTYLPARLCPGLEREDLSHLSLYALLHSRYNIRLASGTRLAESDLCAAEEAPLLGIPAGAPLLVVTSILRDDRGRPVEYGIDRQRGDRAQVEIDVLPGI